MKIAIHSTPNSFSERWIKYCDENQVPYKLVNCYDTDIVQQLDDCAGLMWHWSHADYKAVLFARQLILSLEKKGMKVFPNVNTAWHFDDKVGQKYLLEAIGAPLVKSFVFYSKKEALDWIDTTTFPKVFKLRGGAGSVNVHLAKTKSDGRRLVKKAFGNGFLCISRFSKLKDKVWVFKRDKNLHAAKGIVLGLGRMFIPTELERFSHREKGYIYFQDFIPGNQYDTRLVIIGDRCFGNLRYCRTNDFRASGSGMKGLDPELIDKRCIKSAFEVTKKINAQCLAFDFVIDSEGPKIVEISYGSPAKYYDDCRGYWDPNLTWHKKSINPQYFIIEDFLEELKPGQ